MFGIVRLSQKDKVLKRLQRGGIFGVSNYELNKISIRFGAYLHELRKDGYSISTVAINARKGHYKYYLNEED